MRARSVLREVREMGTDLPILRDRAAGCHVGFPCPWPRGQGHSLAEAVPEPVPEVPEPAGEPNPVSDVPAGTREEDDPAGTATWSHLGWAAHPRRERS